MFQTYLSILIKNEQIQNKNGCNVVWKRRKTLLTEPMIAKLTKIVSICHMQEKMWIIYIM